MRRKKRALAKKGLSYVDANRGRVVTIEDDVLGIKAQIEERWPNLYVVIDYDGGANGDPTFCVVERCADGVDRLGLERPYLDERLIRDLEAADTWRSGQEDPFALIEAHNAKMEAEEEARFADLIGDVGERLAHAFVKDGFDGSVRRTFISNKPESMCS